jgi:hypothetical protein
VDPPIEPVLARTIATVEVDCRSLERAAGSLGNAYGVRVEIDRDRNPVWSAADGGGAPVMQLRDVTLVEALGRVMPRFMGSVDAPSYALEGEILRVGAEGVVDAREPMVVRAYEVGDLFTNYPESRMVLAYMYAGPQWIPERPERVEAFMMLLQETVAATTWGRNGGTGRVSMHGDWMVVTATARTQREVQRFLFLIRHPALPVKSMEAAQ